MQEYCFNNELIEIRKYIVLIESLLLFFFFLFLYNIFTIRDYGSRFRLLASSLASLGFSLGSFRTTGQNLISHPPRWTIIAISMLSLSLCQWLFHQTWNFHRLYCFTVFQDGENCLENYRFFIVVAKVLKYFISQFRPKQISLVWKILSINYIIGVQVNKFWLF